MVENKKLTEKQLMIHKLYYNDNLTMDKISSHLKISKNAVSKHITFIRKKLGYPRKKKELFSIGLQKGGTPMDTPFKSQPIENKSDWRIHGLYFIIRPYYFYQRYKDMIKVRGNVETLERWTIIYYSDKIRIQSAKGIGWRNKDKYKAIQAAEDEFNLILNKIAKKAGFEHEKEGRISIKRVSMELAKENSKIAEGYNNASGKEHLNIKNKEGRVYFVIDKSQGLEHEYIGKTSFEASENIEPYFNDMLYNQPMTNSQIQSRIADMVILLEKQKELNQIILEKISNRELSS